MKQFLILFLATSTTLPFQQKLSGYKGKVKSVKRALYRDPVVTYGPNYVVTEIEPDGEPFSTIAEYFNEDHLCDSIITSRFFPSRVDVHKVVYRYQNGKGTGWETFSDNKKNGYGITTWQTDKSCTVKEYDSLNKLTVVSTHFSTDSLSLYKKTENKRFDKKGKLLMHYIEEYRFDTAQNLLTSTMTQQDVYTTITYYQCMKKDSFGNPVKMVQTTDDNKILCLFEYTYY